MKRKSIEVKFYVYQSDVITKKASEEISSAINKYRAVLENNYNAISKFIGYTPNIHDVLDIFKMNFEDEIVSYTASITYNSKDLDFEEELLKNIEPKMETDAADVKQVARAMCIVIEHTPVNYIYEKLDFERVSDLIKRTFINN